MFAGFRKSPTRTEESKIVQCLGVAGGGGGEAARAPMIGKQSILTPPDVELSLRLTQARQNVIPTDLTIV